MLRENITLLQSLPSLLGCTVKNLCMRIGIPKTTWLSWIADNHNKFNPKVVEFVRICNCLHLPPSKMIQSDAEPFQVPDVKEIYPPGVQWKEVRFDQRAFLACFGERGPFGMSTKEMMSKLKKTDMTFREGWKRTGEECTIRLADLFLFCETFNADINKFLVDPNGRIYTDLPDDTQNEVIKKLRQRERRIRELNKEVARLEEELTLERNARLAAESRIGRLVEELASNNWGFGKSVAAEGEVT